MRSINHNLYEEHEMKAHTFAILDETYEKELEHTGEKLKFWDWNYEHGRLIGSMWLLNL